MISAQNHLRLLSGNKCLLYLIIALLAVACSPKIRQTPTPVSKPDTLHHKKTETVTKKPELGYTPVISLILPFQLDELDLRPGAPKSGLAKANVAAEYYQGFKLALDSLTSFGYNFNVHVYDSKDEQAQTRALAVSPAIRSSDIVIGPVYPQGVKSFTYAFGGLKRILVSPLSPTPPQDYKYPGLVTMIPPLEFHSKKVAGYVWHNLKVKKIFVLRSGFSDENKYLVPFKIAIDSLSKNQVKVITLVVQHGNLSSLIPQLSQTGQNVFIVPGTNQQFLQITLHSLDVLSKKKYPITVFGHPNWEGVSFLKPDLLQRLNTYITSGDRINYKQAKTIRFLKAYREAYHMEPGEYAIKGFDEGMYWGEFVSNKGDFSDLKSFEAIHNTFYFKAIPGMGYVNAHVKLYKYSNFELKLVE